VKRGKPFAASRRSKAAGHAQMELLNWTGQQGDFRYYASPRTELKVLRWPSGQASAQDVESARYFGRPDGKFMPAGFEERVICFLNRHSAVLDKATKAPLRMFGCALSSGPMAESLAVHRRDNAH